MGIPAYSIPGCRELFTKSNVANRMYLIRFSRRKRGRKFITEFRKLIRIAIIQLRELTQVLQVFSLNCMDLTIL